MPPRHALPIATTERLVVRPWRPAEAGALLGILGREEVCRWLGASHREPLVDEDEAAARIRTYAELTLSTPLGVWAVVPHGEEPVGAVMLVQSPAPFGAVELGWYLHPDAQGRGLATEAAAAALRHGFGNGLPDVEATTHPDNVASRAVCARLGMSDLGASSADDGSPVQGYRLTRRQWRLAQRAEVPST